MHCPAYNYSWCFQFCNFQRCHFFRILHVLPTLHFLPIKRLSWISFSAFSVNSLVRLSTVPDCYCHLQLRLASVNDRSTSSMQKSDDKATDMAYYAAVNEAGNCPKGVRFICPSSQQSTHGATLAAISNNKSKLEGSMDMSRRRIQSVSDGDKSPIV